ncbi:DEAD/DEAH box helicase family protein [Mycobacterium ostraviense]|uniref:Helicase/UvrB N-terminal domain-containing protein n=1 Tax=Mycobacterium ostraviense TaxID=2738409 RepID=A0A163T144_9MYCO|nr:hypothetical protein [Mycobacterium ostraviense]KZS54828.1 hypothetical protein A4G28_17670 [Mycobacterium ostraviense]UGT90726.1 hypothetical protein LTS72_21045 [Mycobacterium ostraviense]
MDFDRLLDEAAHTAPIEPRELYAWLPDKAEGYGYMRDVQGQVLTTWHRRRDERDLILKVNTGSGKTIDGLVILQSYLHADEGPALYVAPNKYFGRAGAQGSPADRHNPQPTTSTARPTVLARRSAS